MRIFSGLSFGGRHVRAGISKAGRLWLGARASGPAGAYVGVRSGRISNPRIAASARPILRFDITDEGRVFLGDAEVDLEGLRSVVSAATLARNAQVGIAKSREEF